MINHKEVVKRHNPILTEVDTTSPLTVGNGEFAYSVDITGMQTLYEEYKAACAPLCTMSQWGWHTSPVSSERFSYTMEELKMTEYPSKHGKVTYASNEHPGNEGVYHWLRENPHRLNLAQIGLFYDNEIIQANDITQIHQQLELYEGIITSEFCLHGQACCVHTAIHSDVDAVAFAIDSMLLSDKKLQIRIAFPYGSKDITASDFKNTERHLSCLSKREDGTFIIHRTIDQESYLVKIHGNGFKMEQKNVHEFILSSLSGPHIEVSVQFQINVGASSLESVSMEEKKLFLEYYQTTRNEKQACARAKQCFEHSKQYWMKFWEDGGIIDFSESEDIRWFELERRVILSLYLLSIQSVGILPPQETGLTCNSWYGKFHLEMHFWHAACLPLFHHADLLKKSIPWYRFILEKAKDNAKRNGYKGARWPKMVAYPGVDSPSTIATLLIWQQPHIIYLLELIYHCTKDLQYLKENWILVKETADFMVDFLEFNEVNGKYELNGPYIPAQERHNPCDVKNAVFELEYWNYILKVASRIGNRLGIQADRYDQVANNMVLPSIIDHKYPAHENCTETFTKFAQDHPSMVGRFGVIDSDRIQPEIMRNTLDEIYHNWDYESMWGWDFAMLAMSELRLGFAQKAIDDLLSDSPKNCYVVSGNNYQKTRTDLPLYLPGNGSLLLCVAMMGAGFGACNAVLKNIKKEQWILKTERVYGLPD